MYYLAYITTRYQHETIKVGEKWWSCDKNFIIKCTFGTTSNFSTVHFWLSFSSNLKQRSTVVYDPLKNDQKCNWIAWSFRRECQPTKIATTCTCCHVITSFKCFTGPKIISPHSFLLVNVIERSGSILKKNEVNKFLTNEFSSNTVSLTPRKFANKGERSRILHLYFYDYNEIPFHF